MRARTHAHTNTHRVSFLEQACLDQEPSAVCGKNFGFVPSRAHTRAFARRQIGRYTVCRCRGRQNVGMVSSHTHSSICLRARRQTDTHARMHAHARTHTLSYEGNPPMPLFID